MYDCKFDEVNGILTIDDGVKKIGRAMFTGLDRKLIKKIVMSNSVEVVNKSTFEPCENLEEIVFSDNLIEIEEDAFGDCFKLKEIKFPSSLKQIGVRAFADCKSLEKVQFNEGLEYIKDWAFEGAESLKELNLPNSLISIGNGAFHKSSIESITIPKNLVHIGSEVFVKPLKKINVHQDNQNFKVIDDKFLVKVEGSEAGEGNNSLVLCADMQAEKIIVPKGIQEIEVYVFENFEANEIFLPEGIKSIKDCAFYGCKNLKKLVLPESLTAIGGWVFQKSELEELHIGKNLEEAPNTLFDFCDKLKKITVSLENKVFKTDEENSMLYSSDMLYKSTKGKFPNAEIKLIGQTCFANLDVEEFVIPDSVERIYWRAFFNCKNLRKITFGKSLSWFNGAGIFYKCPNLEEIDVVKENKDVCTFDNKGLFLKKQKDGKEVLRLAVGTKETIIPDNCDGIMRGAFSYVEGINKIKSIKDVSNLKEVETNSQKDALKTIYIPDSVEFIAYNAFSDCPNLEEVDLSKSEIKNIYDHVFANCENLKKVHLPDGISLDRNVFRLGNSREKNKLVDVSIPFNIGSLAQGNERLFNNTNKQFEKFTLRVNGEDVAVKGNIKLFTPNETMVTSDEVIFLDANKKAKVLPSNFFESAKKPFNKLERLTLHNYYKVHAWMDKHSKEVPPYYVVENMPPSEIENFYKYRKDWAYLVKNFKYENINEMRSFFKCCHALGVFNGNKTLIEKAILPNLNAQDIVFMFEKCDSYNKPFNKDFADLFFKFFIKKDEKGVNLKDSEGNFEVVGRNYLTKEDYVSNEWVSVVSDVHNDFNKLQNENSNKTFKGGSGGYSKLREEDIVRTFSCEQYDSTVVAEEMQKFNEKVKDIKDENGNIKYGEDVFEEFVNTVSTRENQKHFVMLAEAFADGLINWEKAENAEKRLICKKDEPNHRVTYDLLEKTDGHGSIIGIMTNCCQRVGENGGSCVEYGMKMPNSGFVTFRYDGKVVGQAWTWYDEKYKQITLDNIETPKQYINEIKSDMNLEKEMVNCLLRLRQGFIDAMGDKVEKVTIGLSCNDMSGIITKYFDKIPVADLQTLSDYKENICLKFGPNGDDKPYSDAEKGDGQVLILGKPQMLNADPTNSLDNGRDY